MFASEIKALLVHPRVSAEVNPDAVASYFAHLVVPAPDTLFAGINKLTGTYGWCDRNGVRVAGYWTLCTGRRWRSDSLSESAAEVRRLLNRSVDDR